MKGITGLGHVAIKVTDLDRSLDYYVNKLGFPEMLRLNKDDGGLARLSADHRRAISRGLSGRRERIGRRAGMPTA